MFRVGLALRGLRSMFQSQGSGLGWMLTGTSSLKLATTRGPGKSRSDFVMAFIAARTPVSSCTFSDARMYSLR